MASAYSTRLANLAQEAGFKLRRSGEYLTSVSILLAECKRRVDLGDPEAEGASWAGYCRLHFPGYSVTQIGRIIDLTWQADHPDGETAFDRAWSAFIALGRKQQHEFLRRGTGTSFAPKPPQGIPFPSVPQILPVRSINWRDLHTSNVVFIKMCDICDQAGRRRHFTSAPPGAGPKEVGEPLARSVPSAGQARGPCGSRGG